MRSYNWLVVMKPCRICGARVKKFLDLGATPPPEELRTKKELKEKIVTYPLGLAYCSRCGEIQLSFEIPPDIMYKENYFYDYSLTKTGLIHWNQLARLIYKKYKLTKKDLVVDIGSNTGSLLDIFKQLGTRILGVDPATNLVEIARRRGIPTINDYFMPTVAKDIVKKYGQATIITCNNTFDHVDDLNDFMRAIVRLMTSDGVCIIEVPYFMNFVKNITHVVYHQQIDYLLVTPFARLFKRWKTEVIDCEKIPFHGGSIRLFVGFAGKHPVSPRVAGFMREEQRLFKNRLAVLARFAKRVLVQRDELVAMVSKLKKKGKSIAAVGASAKGNILLAYSGLGPETVDFLTEKSPLKIGRYTPSGIPVTDDSELLKKQPDYALLLAWNFREEVLKNLFRYTKAGGKFILPIPKPIILK